MIPGAFPIIAGKPPATMTLTDDTHTIIASTTTHTHTGVLFGAADPSRLLVVCISSNTSTAYTGVTIGGVTASNVATGGVECAIYSALVPTGTSGSVVITSSGSLAASAIAVYALYNLNSNTPFDTATDGNNTSPAATSVSVPADGFLIAAAYINDQTNTGSPSWSGGVTQSVNLLADQGSSNGARLTTAIYSATSAATISPSMAVSLASGVNGATASFG